jgi:hypothetical protein
MTGQRRAVLQGPLRPWQLRHPKARETNPLQGYPGPRSPRPAPPVVVSCALDQFDRARTHLGPPNIASAADGLARRRASVHPGRRLGPGP